MSIERRSNLLLLAVVIAAAVLRIWGIGYGLSNALTHPDEGAVFSVSLRFFGRHLNPAFFDWPSLFMYAVAAAFVVYFNIGRMVGWFGREASFIAAATTHPAPLFLIARGLSAAAGIATVAVTYRVGVHLFDRTTALVAALFLAVAALHVRESHLGLTDVSATCLLMTSFLYTVRYWQSGRRRDALLAALLGGLAASTKYNAGIVMVPLLWAIAFRDRSEAWAGRARVIGICALVAASAFAAGTPYALLDAAHFAGALREISEHLRRGHMALAGYAWHTHLTSSLRYGLGLPMLVAGLGGMAVLMFRGRREATLFLLGPAAYFALIGAGQTAFARYILPTIPFLCLAGAWLVTELARIIGQWSQRPAAAPALAAVIAAIVAAPSLWSAIETDRLLARVDNRPLAAAWLRDNFQNGASLFQTGSSYGHLLMRKEGLVPDPRYSEVPIDAVPAPDIIVVLRCPLGYCDVPAGLDRALSAYVPLTAFIAGRLDDPELVYDRDDAFFVPLSGFRAVTRPGPNVEIYERRADVR